MSQIGMDVERPDAVPYFNWDAPVTNAAVRQAIAEGTEEDKVFWISKSCARLVMTTSGSTYRYAMM
jgi:hypothetical protein